MAAARSDRATPAAAEAERDAGLDLGQDDVVRPNLGWAGAA
jgi:hypothetical protein